MLVVWRQCALGDVGMVLRYRGATERFESCICTHRWQLDSLIKILLSRRVVCLVIVFMVIAREMVVQYVFNDLVES